MRIDLEEMKIHLKTMSENSIEFMFIRALAQDTFLLQLPIVLGVTKLQEEHKSVR